MQSPDSIPLNAMQSAQVFCDSAVASQSNAIQTTGNERFVVLQRFYNLGHYDPYWQSGEDFNSIGFQGLDGLGAVPCVGTVNPRRCCTADQVLRYKGQDSRRAVPCLKIKIARSILRYL